MKTLQFKTNVMCAACLAKVTPALNEVAGAGNWTIELNNPDKILSVSNDNSSPAAIINALEKAGYTGKEDNEPKYVTH